MLQRIASNSIKYRPFKKAKLRHFSSVTTSSDLRLDFDEIAKKLSIKHWEDWYEVKSEQLESLNYNKPLWYYGASPSKALVKAYPELDWKLWRFKYIPEGYFHDIVNQKTFFELLGKELDFKTREDWYRLKNEHVEKFGGGTFLKLYNNSKYKTLKTVFPDFDWKPWRFKDSRTSAKYWEVPTHRRDFLNFMSKQYGFIKNEDWYNLNSYDFTSNGGGSLLSYYKNSFAANRVSDKKKLDTGTNNKMQERFFLSLKEKMKIKSWEGFYLIKNSDIAEHGGYGILQVFGGSAADAISKTFPEYDWKMWKFSGQRNFWDDEKNVRQYLEWFEKEADIKTLDDWYGVSGIMHSLYGSTLLDKYGGLVPLLLKFFPNHTWDINLFGQKKKFSKPQYMLLKRLFEIFSSETEILVNYLHPNLIKHAVGETRLELDIYVPALQLAFEYQGAHHYKETMYGDPAAYKKRDQNKRDACNLIGLTLISIPYWWDCTKETLQATIHKYRPDLIDDNGFVPLIDKQT